MKRFVGMVLVGALAWTSGAWAAAFKVGDVVPAEMALSDSKGEAHTFGEFRGAPLVLEWANFGCPFTRKHYDSKNMQNVQLAVTAQGAKWVTVMSSAPGKEGYLTVAEAPAAFAKEGSHATMAALDPTGVVGQAFGATNTPDMVVLDKDGKIVYTGAIDSIASFSDEDIAKATNYVVQAVSEIQAGKAVSVPVTRPYGCSVKY